MNAITAFRIAAIAEALSWTGLVIGMVAKHVLDAGEAGVQVFGPIHGFLFVAYVFAALGVARSQRWSAGVTLAALAASIPPLTTVVFERWATRTGRLEQTPTPAAAAGNA